jgi:tetratricopeptide (TPR) repeat protein
MTRRRRQEWLEGGLGDPPAAQGELLPGDDAHPIEEEVDEVEESIDQILSGRPRELVLFEMVEEVVGPPAVPAPGTAGDRSREAAHPARTPDADRPDAPARPPTVSFDEPLNLDLELERLEAARALSPDSVGVLVNLGWTLGLLGRFDEAERELRKAQKLAPDDLAVRAGIGLLCFRRGLYQQADVELRWVCEQDPEHGPAHFYRGEALNRLGRVDQALEMLERAARIQPTNHRAFYTMGILFDRKNLREEAAAMYRKARELQRW